MGKPGIVPRESRGQGIRSPSVKHRAYPTPDQVADYAAIVIESIMTGGGKAATGSTKSGPGQWFTRDSIRYSCDRAITHLVTAMMMLDGNRDEDDEGIQGHLDRALCRTAFVSMKIKKGQTK